MHTQMHVRVHGTYPFDDYGENWESCWRKLQDLSFAEAAKLVGIEPTLGNERCGLWLNKGYFIVGEVAGTLPGGLSPLATACVEDFARFSARIPEGSVAAYNHDGRYSLIERTAVVQKRRA